jgi:hypothetical protein
MNADLKQRQFFQIDLSPTVPADLPDGRVSFDPLPSVIYMSSDQGEQFIQITGIVSRPGLWSIFDLITGGPGLLTASVEYKHGDSTARLRITPQPGVRARVILDLTLMNADLKQRQFFQIDLSPIAAGKLVAPPVHLTRSTDTSADGIVSPLDALLVINYLNTVGTNSVKIDNDAVRRLDSSGDGFVSPLDVLLIINAINLQIGEGEGIDMLHEDEVTQAIDACYAESVGVSFGQYFDIETRRIRSNQSF